MAAKLPVTVITGFLGSGKTTLLRHLLEQNHGQRLAAIVNEFGEVGIDGALLQSCCPSENLVELTNGCLCCTVQEEFLPTMQALLQRRDRIDRIVIETSGLALPKPLVAAFRWPEIRHAATVDGVVAVLDCAALAEGDIAGDRAALEGQRQADPRLEHETPLEELFEDQLRCADLAILNKIDLVDAAARAAVERRLREEFGCDLPIVAATQSRIDPAILLGLESAVEDKLDGRPSHHDLEEDHDHDETIAAVEFSSDRAFELETLCAELAAIAREYGTYRIKGFANVAGKPMRLVVQGVGRRLDRHFDLPWSTRDRRTTLVLIGKELPAEAIRQRLAAIAVDW